MGPSIEPCGTPRDSSFVTDSEFPMGTYCILEERQDLNQQLMFDSINYIYNYNIYIIIKYIIRQFIEKTGIREKVYELFSNEK